jgi:uncharacterized membrane protein YgcG
MIWIISGAILIFGVVIWAMAVSTEPEKVTDYDLVKRINRIDFKPIEKLLEKKKNWDRAKIDINIVEYKKFLFLVGANLGHTIVPFNDDVDEVWHMHLLDSAKYRLDCINVFGRIIDHNPHLYVGIPKQVDGHKKTQQLYKNMSPSVRATLDSRHYNSRRNTTDDYSTTYIPSSCSSDSPSKAASCGASCNSGASCGGASCGGGGCGGGCGA